jgi:hypothetical protein
LQLLFFVFKHFVEGADGFLGCFEDLFFLILRYLVELVSILVNILLHLRCLIAEDLLVLLAESV